MSNTIPSDSLVAGNTGHVSDHNNIADDLGLLAQALALLSGAVNSPPGGNAANLSAIAAANAAKFPVVLNNISTPSTPSAGPKLYGLSGTPAAIDTQGNINNLSRITQLIGSGTISTTTSNIIPGTTAINVKAGSQYIMRGQIVFTSINNTGNADFRISPGGSSMTSTSVRIVGQFMADTSAASPQINSANIVAVSSDIISAPLTGGKQQSFWFHGWAIIGVAGTMQWNTRCNSSGTDTFSIDANAGYLEYIQIT